MGQGLQSPQGSRGASQEAEIWDPDHDVCQNTSIFILFARGSPIQGFVREKNFDVKTMTQVAQALFFDEQTSEFCPLQLLHLPPHCGRMYLKSF